MMIEGIPKPLKLKARNYQSHIQKNLSFKINHPHRFFITENSHLFPSIFENSYKSMSIFTKLTNTEKICQINVGR